MLINSPSSGIIDLVNPVNKQHSLNLGRIGWWLALPGQIGGITFRDLLKQNDGTLTNYDTTHGWRTTTQQGGYGAIDTDAVGMYVECGTSSTLDLTNVGTLAIWVTMTTSANGVFACKGNVWNDLNSYGIFYYSGSVYCEIDNGSTFNQNGVVTSIVGVPTRLAMTWDGSNLIAYRNGQQTRSISQTINATPSGKNFRMLANGGASTQQIPNAAINDVSVWNRALSAAEIVTDYNLSRIGYPGVLNRLPVPYYGIATAVVASTASPALTLMGVGL